MNDAPTSALTPLTMLQRMVEMNTTPDALKQAMDLFERWKATEAREAFHRAMTECQAELPVIVKDAENSHTRSRYALLETIQHRSKPIITAHGFSISWTEGPIPGDGLRTVIMRVRHRAGHTEEISGTYAMDGQGAKGGAVMSPVQAGVSVHSYAQRDLFKMFFNITIAGEDLDGETRAALSESQVVHIKKLLAERQVDVDKFLFWACNGAPKEELAVENIEQRMYRSAIEALKRKPIKRGEQ